MTIQARLETLENKSRRASPRRTLRLGSTIAKGGVDAVIHDLSATGVLLQTAAKLRVSDELDIDLPEVGATNAVVVWQSGKFYGCEFSRRIPKAAISAALLRNPIAPALRTAQSLATAPDPDLDDQATGLSFGTKLRVILGASIALWAIILWALGIL